MNNPARKPGEKWGPDCACTSTIVCKACDERSRMKLKGKDYDVDPEEAHIEAHMTHLKASGVNLGSHVGPPVKKPRGKRCASRAHVVHPGAHRDTDFSCEELRDHNGSHYGVDVTGQYDMSWNGPDELEDGDYRS